MKKQKTLFIIDAQNDFCTRGGSLLCDGAEQAVKNICGMLRTNDFDEVICTMDSHEKDYLSTMEGRYLPVEHCITCTEGNLLNKDIYDALYEQSWYSMSKNSFMINVEDINDNLISNAEASTDIFVCGFATDICVLNNALILKRLYGDRHKIRLIQDCCAGSTKEMHDMAVKIMKNNHIEIINSNDIRLLL